MAGKGGVKGRGEVIIMRGRNLVSLTLLRLRDLLALCVIYSKWPSGNGCMGIGDAVAARCHDDSVGVELDAGFDGGCGGMGRRRGL
ncbi:unnamed protein product [Protopolystoma xenopodis]|uniref:Uncharacterized protein n=1 Tax=Protopolystoma xenopodis TaxID=117903 RepID=A0A3S5B6I3_9PLAT|nr:unnamed protein product [Protopolystoma xenopodis]